MTTPAKIQPPAAKPMSSLVLGDFVNKLVCDGAMTVQQGQDLMAIVRKKDDSHASLVTAIQHALLDIGSPGYIRGETQKCLHAALASARQ